MWIMKASGYCNKYYYKLIEFLVGLRKGDKSEAELREYLSGDALVGCQPYS